MRDLVRSQDGQQSELRLARRFGPPVGKIDDFSLPGSLDCRMRIIDEAGQSLRKPVIAPRLLAFAAHALLDDGPLSIVGDNKAVQVKIEAILHCRAVDLRNQAACLGKSCSIDTDSVTDGNEFLRRSPRMVAASSTDVNAQLVAERCQPSLERAYDARGDAGGMPVHPHHRPE